MVKDTGLEIERGSLFFHEREYWARIQPKNKSWELVKENRNEFLYMLSSNLRGKI